MKLPDSLSSLFKNYVFESIDDEKHSALVIKTVLSRGSWEQIMWLFQHYGREEVGEVFLDDYYGLRTFPESTRRLWELLFVEQPTRDGSDGASRWRCRRLTPGR